MEKAVVVFSGGQDSTTCLAWAQKKFDEVVAISFDYGQRHKKELECATGIAAQLGIPHRIISMELLNQLAPNALTRDDIEVAEGKDGGLPTTFVDGRNHIFLSFAAILAKQLGAKHIVTGVCETDFSGYPDCRDVFVKSLNVTLNLAMDYQFVIHTPLMWLNKAETWELADRLGVLWLVKNETLTCYNGVKGDGCGKCPACKLRHKGYAEYMTHLNVAAVHNVIAGQETIDPTPKVANLIYETTSILAGEALNTISSEEHHHHDTCEETNYNGNDSIDGGDL